MIVNHAKLFVLAILLILSTGIAKAQHITLLQQGKPTSIRGLSVLDDSVAWVSGSKGYIAKTTNGGKTWAWQQLKGYERSDFRGIQAFSAKEAIIMSSGTPALVLKTIDGGNTWIEKYRNTDTTYFLDAMDFADAKHGYILGDPIGNKFVLLETNDSGDTWNKFKTQPNALTGEAAFAASNTCLRVEDGNIVIVTGGKYCRKLTLNKNTPDAWQSRDLDIIHGRSSQGAFSTARGSCDIVVGGDYQNDTRTDSVAEYWCYNGTYAGGPMRLSKTPPSGYQSSVEYIKDNIFLSTGTPGTNITIDSGQTWAKIDTVSFNVCRKAKHGTLVLLAGNEGKIAFFKL
jgi:photosystem II stability/assembly factor-like uncharacterized protein